ncbi:hypothetical protein ACW7G0_07560 [Lysobacter sp. A286]
MSDQNNFTQEDYDQALKNVEDQRETFRTASEKQGTSHSDKYKTLINIKLEKLKEIRDAMVAAGTLSGTTPKVKMEVLSSQIRDVWSERQDD